MRRAWAAAAIFGCLLSLPAITLGWTPLAVVDDPLVRMPGTQPDGTVSLDGPGNCMSCHSGYDAAVEPGHNWRGSMMAHAERDPIYWASLVVAEQDAIWLLGNPNAGDLCVRCHSPEGWVEGRSDPTNGAALTGSDFDGVHCEGCHRLYDPFFEDTASGLREGDDWMGYWDESGDDAVTLAAAVAATLLVDRAETATIDFFDDRGFFGADNRPLSPFYTENGAGQMFYSSTDHERGPFVDDAARHTRLYSRYHKSRFFCGTCHDVSNAALANALLPPVTVDGSDALPSEALSAHSYFHVERTFSEMMLSDYGVGAGAPGSGFFDPSTFDTSRPGNLIATCQDCHMADRPGEGAKQPDAVSRPENSLEHPQSGQPVHDLTGGNVWVPLLLASAVPGSPNHDVTNEALLTQGPATLTMDLSAGDGLDADALLDGSMRSLSNLERAASFEQVDYDPATGDLSFRIRNHTGHKLPTGYPEGRRMFVNIRAFSGVAMIWEVNPYDFSVGTLIGLDAGYSPSSPPAGASQEYSDSLVYEAKSSSRYLPGDTTFHFVLADGLYKDNRIPPLGFRIADALGRQAIPRVGGFDAPGLYDAIEYAGGHDDVSLSLPDGADRVEIALFYQTTSREYVEFLRDEINGTATSLSAPAPSGEPDPYIVQSDPFFNALAAWGDTIWQLWQRNSDLPGAAPVEMATASWTAPPDMDGGVSMDAGSPVDAGTDAGSPVDAGTDAGSPVDAGTDAGSRLDAGNSPADAGGSPAEVGGGGCGCRVGGVGSRGGAAPLLSLLALLAFARRRRTSS